jgi:hypothetical protein
MLCDLQFFNNIIDDNDPQEQLTSQIICGDNEFKPACFSPESQVVLQLPGQDITIAN